MKNSIIDRAVQSLFANLRTTSRDLWSRLPRLRTGLCSVALAAALACGGTANAASLYWNAATEKWETEANWNVGSQTGTGHQVPTNADTVYINNGGTALIDGYSPPANAGTLYIGSSGTGVLNLTNGGKGTSTYSIYLGNNAGSSGTVTVDGANSLLEGKSTLYVGYSGTGVLNLTNGGKATSNGSIYLGYQANSSGTVTVDGAGSELKHSVNSTALLYVGDSGTGVLNLTNGGKATSQSTIELGNQANSSGTVTVDGASTLESTAGGLNVGYSGTGVLNLTNGGKATSKSDITLGYQANSSGTVTVDGAGSELKSNTSELRVGHSGTGVLNLTNGGKATSNGSIYLGRYSGSSGTVTVDGASTLESTAGGLHVGSSGTVLQTRGSRRRVRRVR